MAKEPLYKRRGFVIAAVTVVIVVIVAVVVITVVYNKDRIKGGSSASALSGTTSHPASLSPHPDSSEPPSVSGGGSWRKGEFVDVPTAITEQLGSVSIEEHRTSINVDGKVRPTYCVHCEDIYKC